MLHFIKGRAGSGKTKLLREIINNKIDTEGGNLLLLIPEQFSFETDRTMLKFLGAKKHKAVDVTSFERLALSTLKDFPALKKRSVNGGVRAALMSEALQSLEGRINVFSSQKTVFSALSPLVELCNELKYCRITGDTLISKTDLVEEGFLKEKLKDLYLINEAYTALLSQNYFDDTEAVELLCEYALENGTFKNKTVFFDGFRAFSKQDAECFSIILSQAKDVYVTLCTDENIGRYTSFYYVKEFEKTLRGIAAKNSITVTETYCAQSADAFSSDIFQLEQNLFSSRKTEALPTDGSVSVVKCIDKADECKYVASAIKKLIRSGKYRCRDIAVIERQAGSYKELLSEELKALDIPVFEDSRRSLKYEALFVYVSSVLACVTQGLNTENIMTYLKSGLSGLSVTEISRLEKYALMWNVGVGAWRDGFTMHPDGFGIEFDDRAHSTLDEINKARKKAVLPLLKLKKDCEDKTCKEITAVVYSFIDNEGIKHRLFDLYTSLNESGFPVEANRQAVSWDVFVELLDEMAALGADSVMTLSRWFELFAILVDSGEIGEIPQGLDEVKIGNAERIRTEKLKVVFLVGVNKNEFPLVAVKGGILTDADRVCLTNLGLEIKPPYKDSLDEEYFICYCAATAASEKLYLTYRSVDADGSESLPSEIIGTAISSIENVRCISTADLDPVEYVESEDSAFSLLAKNYKLNNELRSTLLTYFQNKPHFAGKIKALDAVAGKRDYSFSDSSISTSLFKENIYLSASKIEQYHNCPFSYFVRYGLNAEPLRVAELDPAQSGTVIHLVMEKILQKYPDGEFPGVSDEALRVDVEEALDEYIETKMGGKADKSKRFMYLYNHLVETCMAILSRLKQEFSTGSFVPCGFEVGIGEGDIPHYEVELDNGKAMIKGSVDRVDILTKDGISYIRIIDYKTGKKEFKLSELFDGLNVQMVLYLMALEKNAKHVYGEFLPAGVLYLPSKIGLSDYLKKRSPAAEEIAHQRKVCGKLSGMVLESLVVLNGMGAIDSPEYFPAGYDEKKERFTGNTYSSKHFRSLSRVIDGKIKAMGDALHSGNVPAIPTGEKDEGKMCKYCSYRAICGYEIGDEIREIQKLSHADALKALGGDDNE